MAQASACPICSATDATLQFSVGGFAYLRCRQCGHLWTDPLPSDEQIRDFYNGRARHSYDTAEHEALEAIHVERFEHYYRQFERAAGISLKGKRVLDIGCYMGLSMQALARLGADAHGVDLQHEAVAIANARFPGKVKCCDITSEVPFPGTFDVLVMTDVIEHLKDPRAFCRALEALSSSGTVFYITTPDAGSRLGRTLGRYWPSISPVHHIHHYSRRSLALLLAEHGIEVERSVRLFKRLSLGYVRWILPRLNERYAGFVSRIPLGPLAGIVLPLYGGEMMVFARRSARR